MGLATLRGSYSEGTMMGQFELMDQMTLSAGFFCTVNLLPESGSFRYNLTPQVLLVSQYDRQLPTML